MEAWKAILIAFGGNAALISILACLANKLISEWMKRASEERLIVFSKLHEKRADAIARIHFALYEYVTNMKSFIILAEHEDEDRKEALFTKLNDASKNFRDTFQNNKLYLKKDLCNKIEEGFMNAQLPSYNFIFHLGSFDGKNISESEFRKVWEKTLRIFAEKLPKILESLETEFRKIIGAENFS